MTIQPVHTMVLCEDLQQEVFVRRFLKLRGWETRQIRARKAPGGEGSAEQWVRERFPQELRSFRARDSHTKTCLIVVLDADIGTVDSHVQELERACYKGGLGPRTAKERVLLLVPRRNIETWLAFLRGGAVEESALYARHRRESQCQREVDKLDALCRGHEMPLGTPPSLLQACKEYERLEA